MPRRENVAGVVRRSPCDRVSSATQGGCGSSVGMHAALDRCRIFFSTIDATPGLVRGRGGGGWEVVRDDREDEAPWHRVFEHVHKGCDLLAYHGASPHVFTTVVGHTIRDNSSL